ncbi:ATP-binding protein [Accumulibacter sp.]|uniref:ATP-dependent nuclease n=1 Tax=Accumulibacter sp. TaxID=2053492 RepID=UPI001ACDADA2|nr:ATP-binding protein [Accumulibacter sp.]MBN8452785.1 AAA family ATPase [Accumulibacter sp.]MBO3707715.1 AAA family ATPase [Candidatus Accumulibacter conexus]
MSRIRKLEIAHFRSIRQLAWCPSDGINCLIGPGDSGKSSILDAIDLCLGARRNIQFTDADFHRLDVGTPISISVTLGELDDGLKNLETYGMFVRGFYADSGLIEDEPEKDAETVLTVRLTVGSDLEPSWSLISARAEAQGLERNLSWGDRVRLAPTRIGVMADFHLSWRRGSVLNRVSDERADASAALAKAARDARAAFGDEVQDQLGATLGIVATTAKELGIPIGDNIKAMLDAHSVSFSGGTISLHDAEGIPLRGLGIGSARLLIAGLQRKAATRATIILIDELEHGLEPHRIIRLLGSLGAKETPPPLQVFVTTHSPVALQELAGNQLFVTRSGAEEHDVLKVGTANDIQSTIRKYPDAFLAPSVIVYEGASEVGLVRGLDQYRAANGYDAITAQGTALLDCGGGDADMPFKRASAFRALGYRAAVVRDDDKKPTAGVEAAFIAIGGTVVAWREGRALEDELFLSLTDDAVDKLIDRAIELHGEELVNEHIKSASQNGKDLNAIRMEALIEGVTTESRQILGRAARSRKAGWFKSVTWMEAVARDVVGPDLESAEVGFRALVEKAFAWTSNAGQ